MLFNSIAFLLFLPTVFILYWEVFKKNFRHQNVLIVVVSYFFYAWWDWRFLSLILFSTLVDYLAGKYIYGAKNDKQRKIGLAISLTGNLGLLFAFKYFNFFIESFQESLEILGLHSNVSSLKIILPIGISFYTFQTLSYTLDIYRKKLKTCCTNFIEFAAFVGFFPQLVAGPIEKAHHLLPQFQKARTFDKSLALSGLNQIIWGFFKKLVIADNAGILVDQIFQNYESQNGFTLLLGAVFFAFQMYGDIAGYTDIAIGTGKLFGFQLTQNFNLPLFAKNFTDFWNRWHISLSKWFYEYLYFPAIFKYRNLGKLAVHIAIWITFTISGLWHGANWNSVLWGMFYASFLSIEFAMSNWRKKGAKKFPRSFLMFGIAITLILNLHNWILFRSTSLSNYWQYLSGIFSSKTWVYSISLDDSVIVLLLFGFWFIELLQFKSDKNFYTLKSKWYVSAALMLLIFMFGAFENASDFIYFQF